MKDLAGAITMLKGYEGNVPYMYLDSRGLVTVGVGFLLSTAQEATLLTFWRNPAAGPPVHKPNATNVGKPPIPALAGVTSIGLHGTANAVKHIHPVKATHDEIKKEWTAIKGKPTPHTANYYKPFTTMTMSQGDIDAHLTKTVNHFEGIARHAFADWDKFASPAQLALLDMIYNLGSLINFPKLEASAKKKDWTNCAEECHRSGPNQQRNDDTKSRFLAAAKEQPLVIAPPAGIHHSPTNPGRR